MPMLFKSFNSGVLTCCIIFMAASNFIPRSCPARESFTNKIGMNFIKIPAGSFIMGSPESEMGRNWNERQHRVVISKSFYMGETEVTQGQWNRLASPNPSTFKVTDEYPVDSVNWNEAVLFIAFLNKLEKTTKYRLPTEAEWEYACRAGSSAAFARGGITTTSCDEPEPALEKMAWYCFNSGRQNPASDFRPHPVKTMKPNKWGLYDMHGNVQEWVQDACRWRTFLHSKVGVITDTYENDIVDPLNTTGDHKIIRGGGWHQNGKYQRCAYRSYYKPTAVRNSLGFRIVRDQ